MRLLLDTHVLLALLGAGSVVLTPDLLELLRHDDTELTVSAASFWEIAIKVRAGKLGHGMPLATLPDACDAAAAAVLSIDPRHVLHDLQPRLATRDPFDRLLLAQAGVEGMRLVTLDRTLVGHPLAWAPTGPPPPP